MKIILLDQKEEMTCAWDRYFSNQTDVKIVKDDFVWFMNDNPEVD